MELPIIGADRILRSGDFLSFAINHKQQGKDWKAFGKRYTEFLLSFVVEKDFDKNDKKQVEQQLDSILNPIVMLIGVEVFLNQDKKNIWEMYLLQQASQNDSQKRVEKTAMDWFGEGLTETLTDKWPLAKEL
jgi:hypothetical protein